MPPPREQHLNINSITGKTRQLFPRFLQLNGGLFSVDPSALPSWMDVIVGRPSPPEARRDPGNKGWFSAWCDELTPVPMWRLWSSSRCQLSGYLTFLGEQWSLGHRPLNMDRQCMTTRSDEVRCHHFCLAKISPRGELLPLLWGKGNHNIFNSAKSIKGLKRKSV